MSKLTIPTMKPRNPIVRTGRLCGAGVHRNGSLRQRAARELRRELDGLNRNP